MKIGVGSQQPFEAVLLHGSINHVSITVSDLDAAMAFLGPILEFLGFGLGEPIRNPATDSRLTVNINAANGLAFNVWEAKPALADRRFEVYAPGLHHIAFNVASPEQVDWLCEIVRGLGGEILDGPGEFPYAEDGLGYYAFYFRGPDGRKFECVHMPGLLRLHGGADQGRKPSGARAGQSAKRQITPPAHSDPALTYRPPSDGTRARRLRESAACPTLRAPIARTGSPSSGERPPAPRWPAASPSTAPAWSSSR